MAYRLLNLVALTGLAATFPARIDNIILGSFIVTLKPDTSLDLNAHAQWVSGIYADNIRRRGGSAPGIVKSFDLPPLLAYSGSFDEETLEIIKANASALRVEPDQIVHVASPVAQENPPWGLSTFSNASPPCPNSSYLYDSSAGEGIFSYIFDTGLLSEHVDFHGRAVEGTTPFTGETDLYHGTFVATIVGGATFGAAKKKTLIDVLVLSTNGGSMSTILGGLDWTLDDVASKNRKGKSVANMSLNTLSSPTFNDAVQQLIDAGIPVAISAGNTVDNASDYSPGNQPRVITVGASDINYRRAAFSSYGPAVDIFGPGVDVLTASSASPNATIVTSGTSEAAPHVAGVVAYLLGLEGPRTPAQAIGRQLELALPDLIQDPQGAANMFLYNGISKSLEDTCS